MRLVRLELGKTYPNHVQRAVCCAFGKLAHEQGRLYLLLQHWTVWRQELPRAYAYEDKTRAQLHAWATRTARRIMTSVRRIDTDYQESLRKNRPTQNEPVKKTKGSKSGATETEA